MLYHPPYGSTDPDAVYVDRNTPGAVRGSVPPAAAIEDPMRELVALITFAGLSPADGDLQQVAKAVRQQHMNYVVAGGTGNALTATLAPAPTSWADLIGMPIRLVMTAAPSGPATFNPNGLGAKSLVKRGGNAVLDREWLVGDIVEVVYDGTVVRMMSAQRVGLDAAGFQTYSANAVLTPADLGKYTNLNQACAQVTLPKASDCASGSVIALHNTRSGVSLTVQAASGEDFTIGTQGAGSGLTSFSLANQESVLLVAYSDHNNWVAITGSAQARYTPGFGSALSTAGYKRHPDANSPTGYIIEQWGIVAVTTANTLQAVTLPAAFPTAFLGAQGSITAPGAYGGAAGLSLSQINVWCNNSGSVITWRAWGY